MWFVAMGPCSVCGKELGAGEGKVVYVDDGSMLPALEDFCDECIEREKRCEQCTRFLIEGRKYCSMCDEEKIEEEIEKNKIEAAEYARKEGERVRQEYLDTLTNTCEECGDKFNGNGAYCDTCGRKAIKGEL
jgi:uncharacterized OB-fold protein